MIKYVKTKHVKTKNVQPKHVMTKFDMTNQDKKKNDNKMNVLQAFCMMIPKIVSVSPIVFIIWQIMAVAHGISYGVIAPIAQRFYDQAADYATGNAELKLVVSGLVFLALAHIIKQVFNGVSNFIPMMYYRKTEGVLSLGLHKKMSRIAPICFEDTQMLDDMNKAIQGKNEAVWFTGTILAMLNFYIPYFLCMAVYMFKIKPLLVISLALVFTPTLLTQIFRTKVFAKAEDKSAPVRREFEYYENCLTGREYFKETRILGAFSYFRTLYHDSLVLLNKLRFKAFVKSDMAELGMQLLSLCGYVGILLLLLDSLLKGEISVGAFAAIFGSVDQMFSIMKELICYNFGAVARDFGRVKNYLRFLQMPERGVMSDDKKESQLMSSDEKESQFISSDEKDSQFMNGDKKESQIIGSDELASDSGISLSSVSFSYPGAKQKAIDNVTLTIKPQETVAIVGENGSGKSTLIRLITGLYLPSSGDVLYGTVNTKDVTDDSLFKRISAVFQKYQRYQMTLRENIGISNVDKEVDDEILNIISNQAGIDKNDSSFINGYDTMLSLEFDGVDLSGGQWQRVAIARSFFRTHEFIVLDEPTAAIDPIEETKIYNRFAKITKDKTALIVTHRLGSVKLADRILVMKHGRLVEQGTHIELMKALGEYARLYTSQEQWYKV